jgi:hypothetical protein
MDDQRIDQESGKRKLSEPAQLLLAIAVAFAIPTAILLCRPLIDQYRYERARTAYGGKRFTRSRAMEQKDNRTVYLLPDSEFLPEESIEEK